MSSRPSSTLDRRHFMASAALTVASARLGVAQANHRSVSVVTSGKQVNGVASASDGRVFVSLPRWIDADTFSLGLSNRSGTLTPYPGGKWNAWRTGLPPGDGFVCVNAVHVDPQFPDRLWVVDAAAPAFGNIVEGGPKLVAIDLKTNKVTRSYAMGSNLVPVKGYLNDVRFARGHAFLTESGTGAILVLNLDTGQGRRLLADHPSTKAVPGRVPTVDGRQLVTPKGTVPQVHVDGIELSPDREWLLYAVPFGGWLWRVRVAALLDERLNGADLGKSVEQLGPLMPIGGMTAAGDGGLFLSDIEHHAIVHRSSTGTLTNVTTDSMLQWPDASVLDSSGNLLVAASQVNHMPSFNGDIDAVSRPFHVVKETIPASLRGFFKP